MSDLPRVTLHGGEFYQVLSDDDSLHDYIKTQLKGTITKSPVVIKAEKSRYVLARKGKAGEAVTVYTSDGNREADETVPLTGVFWILTRADQDGNAVLNGYGQPNSWIVPDETFKRKYDTEHMTESGLIRPLSKEQLFLRIDDNIVIYIHQGEGKADILEYLKEGSFLNIQNPDDIYGIAGDEFQSTYRVTDSGSGQMQKDIDRILKEL